VNVFNTWRRAGASFYYEGGQTTIYRCEPEKIDAALSVECGA
jgi:hypothetical protein